MQGTIKTLTDKGFGFITVEGEEKDLFFHSKNLQGVTYAELKVGDILSFDKEASDKGPNAVNVTLVSSGAGEAMAA
ncbi:MAG: cold shock domain-containing protein [Parcubacteria group bacterium]